VSPLSAADLRAVKHWLRGHGIARPEDYRDTFLNRRVQARMQAMGQEDVHGFLRAVDTCSKSRDAFFQRFFVPTTEFLRNPEVFEEAARLTSQRAQAWGHPIRVLSAACSTGEEAYGIALLLLEKGLDCRVLALDRSRLALDRLRAGAFEERVLAKVDKRLRERYFIRGAVGFKACDELLSRVQPACWDIGGGFPRGTFHMVFLRNVLIYLTEEAKVRLLGEVTRVLVPGGILVLGRTESAGRCVTGDLAPLDRDKRIYERVRI
jgi:chemotaxis methyl-accepting protein methylase